MNKPLTKIELMLDTTPFYKIKDVYNSIKKTIQVISKTENTITQIQSNINLNNNIKQNKAKIANINKRSYASRFLIKRQKSLFKKTNRMLFNKNLTVTQEADLFFQKSGSINKESNRFLKNALSKSYSKIKILSQRAFKRAFVYITFSTKNVFVTASEFGFTKNGKMIKKVVAKQSCGTNGFRNKKKTTDYAHQQTIKKAGKILLYNNYSCIDIIFTSQISFKNRRSLKSLLSQPMYVRAIIINHNRPHSFVRKYKALRK